MAMSMLREIKMATILKKANKVSPVVWVTKNVLELISKASKSVLSNIAQNSFLSPADKLTNKKIITEMTTTDKRKQHSDSTLYP